jgi:signal transduction histidine kinase
MSFLDTLHKHLQEILDRPAQARGKAPSVIDPAIARSQLIRCFQRLEERDRAAGKSLPRDEYKSALEDWFRGDAVVRFALRMEQLLREGMSRDASPQELEKQIEIALARRLGLPDELPSVIHTLELDRLSLAAEKGAFAAYLAVSVTSIADYATEIRAIRRKGAFLSVTPIGRVFLELTGRDAIRWLLHVEAAQSTGPGDSWRVSRETAQELVRKTAWVLTENEWYALPHSRRTLKRLEELGLISITKDGSTTGIAVLPVGRELLGEIETGAESPMSILAKSLLADLTLSAAEVVSKPFLEEAGTRASTAEATARQARLVAHEIRNALVPVKTSLGALYREILLNPSSEVLARRRESIDRGVDSVFRFVEQLVKVSELAAKPPEPFDPLTAVRDAASLVESETGRRIEQVLPESLPPVSGHRARVVMAITNVLRNAAQAVTGPNALIRVSAESKDDGRAVLLIIEDNGPGVPEDMRQAIFEEGISLRPGGIGMGLALVREVFEKEMKGLVDCGASQLGGARFAIRMPSAGVE